MFPALGRRGTRRYYLSEVKIRKPGTDSAFRSVGRGVCPRFLTGGTRSLSPVFTRFSAGAEDAGGLVQEVELLLEVRAHEAFVEVVLERAELLGVEWPFTRERQQPRGVAAIEVFGLVSGHGAPPCRTRSAPGTCAARSARGAASPSSSTA